MTITATTFEQELLNIFRQATNTGKSYIDVKSGDLHRRVGGYPSNNHRMPICCSILRKHFRNGDTVISSPPSGQGATLIIRYLLPR